MFQITASKLKDEVKYFRMILKQHGYFWDVGQLRNNFLYNRTLNPETVKKLWQDFLNLSQGGGLNRCVDIYVHIPFCSSKCCYCMYPSRILENSKDIDRYVDYLIENMDYYALTFKNFTFRNLYVGGGTPTILDKKQMERLFSHLFNKFSFVKNSQKTTECNPHSSQEPKFTTLRKFGFNRISFGVQSLNPRVLHLHKRSYQEYQQIKRSILLARKVGFKDINVDLMVGLAGDSLDHFRQSFLKIAMLEPDNIVVYGLMPPSKDYLLRCLKMSRYHYFMRHYPRMIFRALEIMKSLSQKFGYGPDSLDPYGWRWGFHKKSHAVTYESETYSGEFGGSILGLGVFSRSCICEQFEYRQSSQTQHFESSADIYEGRYFRQKEAMIRYIINKIDRDSKISLGSFRNIFHCDCRDVFPYAFYALKVLEKIRIIDDDLYLIIKKPEDKYIYTLFFCR
ncbi:MAG: radical SAM protein [Candidatus Omnitrophota bacterium]